MNTVTILGKRKEVPAEENDATMPKSQEQLSTQPNSIPKNQPVVSKPAEHPCNASPRAGHTIFITLDIKAIIPCDTIL